MPERARRGYCGSLSVNPLHIEDMVAPRAACQGTVHGLADHRPAGRRQPGRVGPEAVRCPPRFCEGSAHEALALLRRVIHDRERPFMRAPIPNGMR